MYPCCRVKLSCARSSGVSFPEEDIGPVHVSKHWPRAHQNDLFDVKLSNFYIFLGHESL